MMSLRATARRTLACLSPASHRPRSAKTFPELRVTGLWFLPFTISGLVIVGRGPQPSGDQFHVGLRRSSSFRRFFLERMQHIDSKLKLHRVDRPMSIASVVRDDFKNAGTDSLPRLSAGVLPAKLRDAKRHADCILDGVRKIHEIVMGRGYPKQSLFSGNGFGSRHGYYPSSRISCLSRIFPSGSTII